MKHLLEELFRLDIQLSTRSGSFSRTYHNEKRINRVISLCIEESIEKEKIRVLDIGCGKGHILERLNNFTTLGQKADFYGVDLLTPYVYLGQMRAITQEKDNLNYLASDACSLPFQDNTFDIVICTEMLEHLTIPEKCVKEIFRILKALGFCVITTPKLNNLAKSFTFVNPVKTSQENVWLPHSGHVSVKTTKEWIEIFEKVGLKTEKLTRGSFFFGSPTYDQHPILSGLMIIADVIFDKLHLNAFSELTIIKFRKPK